MKMKKVRVTFVKVDAKGRPYPNSRPVEREFELDAEKADIILEDYCRMSPPEDLLKKGYGIIKIVEA